MPGRKKFRIELEDAEGSKYNLSLEGNISKDKILKIVEFMDLLNIENEGANNQSKMEEGMNRLTPASVGDRISALVETKFPYGSFTSSDILELFEDTYNEPIKLSIISTYLSRYAERGRLVRNRQGKEWVYRTATTASVFKQHPNTAIAESRVLGQHRTPPPSPTAYDQLQ